MGKMKTPRLGLSLQFVDAEARQVDWREIGGDGDGYELQLPDATYGDWIEHDGDAPDEAKRIAKRSPNKPLSDEHQSEFEQSDAYYEWKDGFEPMMNFAWPVSLAYEHSLSDAIDAMAEHARACVLIELGERQREELFGWGSDAPDYVIGLTGGGMDLSDHIAAAYLACGCVPPQRILSGLAGVISAEKARRLPLREAYRTSAEHYAYRAKQLREQSRRVHAKREG